MQRIVLIFFVVTAGFLANCQTYIQDGDRCFDSGDYVCAINNYENAFKNATGRDKQISEIKLTRANWCAEHLKIANQAFSEKKYSNAKEEYQKVLDSNPQDSLAQSQYFLSFYQSYIQNGDLCFDNVDYDCSISNYENAFKNATGKDKQFAEIKLTRAKWCAEHLKIANQAFEDKIYSTAKEEYQKVLDSNPNDLYVKAQISKCENALIPIKLRKATSADIADIWANKYGIHPERRVNLIKAGIDPDDAQRRINAGEGRAQEMEKIEISLSVSKTILFFSQDGGTSDQIFVFTNANNYLIPLNYVPPWCTISKFKGYFVITVTSNPHDTTRKDWFKVTAGEKEVKVYIEQTARKIQYSQNSNLSKNQRPYTISKRCINCPLSDDIWGLTIGYAKQTIHMNSIDVVQLGLKAEPLFRYGFGLNTGINFLGFSKSVFTPNSTNKIIAAYAINIPVHLEYRFNFSKWFNLYSYCGLGFNAYSDSNFVSYSYPATLEYGSGFRINRLQLNLGRSIYVGDWKRSNDLGKITNPFIDLMFSVSYFL